MAYSLRLVYQTVLICQIVLPGIHCRSWLSVDAGWSTKRANRSITYYTIWYMYNNLVAQILTHLWLYYLWGEVLWCATQCPSSVSNYLRHKNSLWHISKYSNISKYLYHLKTYSKSSHLCKSKVCDDNMPLSVKQQVLWLQVSSGER